MAQGAGRKKTSTADTTNAKLLTGTTAMGDEELKTDTKVNMATPGQKTTIDATGAKETPTTDGQQPAQQQILGLDSTNNQTN